MGGGGTSLDLKTLRGCGKDGIRKQRCPYRCTVITNLEADQCFLAGLNHQRKTLPAKCTHRLDRLLAHLPPCPEPPFP